VKNYDETIDLLRLGLSTEAVLSLQPSIERQKRVRYLLARNKAGNLSKDEAAELNALGEIEHAVQLIKARRLITEDKL
jgi:hypothetical protein